MVTVKTEKIGWLQKLRQGLARSSDKLLTGIDDIFNKNKLDHLTLGELEELLIASDVGVDTAHRLVSDFAKNKFESDTSSAVIKRTLAHEITRLMTPYATALTIDRSRKPFVIMVVGVNGSGKTTTLGKMAYSYEREGYRVLLAACDTFRAGAASQLAIWAERAHVPLIRGQEGSDAAALAFQALERARDENRDILFIDTAGRLQNKDHLMQELAKIIRVLKKIDPTAPHATLLVLDATTGQNALSQVEVFKEITQVTGLIVTKLDGSAKAGTLIALADRFHLPIQAIGVGEQLDDLQPFAARDFAYGLMGLKE